MSRSTIPKLVKLPLQIPFETAGRYKREADVKSSRNIPDRQEDNLIDHEALKKAENSLHPKGYIKYPAYDFF